MFWYLDLVTLRVRNDIKAVLDFRNIPELIASENNPIDAILKWKF